MFLLTLIIPSLAYATGFITLGANIKLNGKYGNLVTNNRQILARYTLYANGTFYIDLRVNTLGQIFSYTATSYGNGTFNIVFATTDLLKVTASKYSYLSYINPPWNINIRYTSSQTSLLILAGGVISTEPQTVLFKDDFLYQTNYLSNQWTVDQYQAATEATGVYTQSGYLVYSQASAATAKMAGVHVTNPVFTVGMDNTTFYKRKLTVSLLPYKTAGVDFPSEQSSIETGFGPILTSGAYPGLGPAGTVNGGLGGGTRYTCNGQTSIELVTITQGGGVQPFTCGPAGVQTLPAPTKSIDPTLYTVITVEYAGLPNIPSTQWVYFRIYQEDSNNNVITSTDQTYNVTTNINPFAMSNYVFIQHLNKASATGNLVSRVDLVQLQSYGSPVDLKVPLSIPFPTCASPSCPTGFIGLLTALSFLMGLGNTQFGAINLFLITMAGTAGLAIVWTKRVYVTLIAGILDISMFIYAGLLPTWILFLMLLTTAFLTLLLFRVLIGFGGGGDSPGGDSSEGGTSGGIE